MVSGVGPKETLEKFDIDVISELKGVGQNMWVRITVMPSMAAYALAALLTD
jgi:hypothetical protein